MKTKSSTVKKKDGVKKPRAPPKKKGVVKKTGPKPPGGAQKRKPAGEQAVSLPESPSCDHAYCHWKYPFLPPPPATSCRKKTK